MSLGVGIKGPEGIVLAADSRVTLEASRPGGPVIPVNYDNATKLLSFSKPHNHVGVVTYGAAVIGQRTAHSFVPEFEQKILGNKKRLSVGAYASKLSAFFMERWVETGLKVPPDYQDQPMTFIIGGYNPGEAYGRIFLLNIPNNPKPIERNKGENNFGMTWGGQLEIASRLIHGMDPAAPGIIREVIGLDAKQEKELYKQLKQKLEFPIPYMVLPLQDCVDLALFLVKTTMTMQRLAIGIRGVGGPIDVSIITRTRGLEYIQQKEIRGETA